MNTHTMGGAQFLFVNESIITIVTIMKVCAISKLIDSKNE